MAIDPTYTVPIGELVRIEDALGQGILVDFNTLPWRRDYISGLVIANNGGDADHDLDITIGEARSDDNTANMSLASAFVKSLGPTDMQWVVGTGNGGLDGTEGVAGTPDNNTWYHVYLIKRPDTGVVDICFSENAATPSIDGTPIPVTYTLFRLIGSVLTDGSANIIAFHAQELEGGGVDYTWNLIPLDITITAPGTGANTLQITTPLGLKIVAKIRSQMSDGSTVYGLITSLEQSNSAANNLNVTLNVSSGATEASVEIHRRTNTLSEIRYRSSLGSGINRWRIWTLGWIDSRR